MGWVAPPDGTCATVVRTDQEGIPRGDAVGARLPRLGRVPQRRAVLRPVRGIVGRQDEAVLDAGLARVVVDAPLAFAGDDLAGAVGRGRRGRAPGAAFDRLDREVVARHGRSPAPAGAHGEPGRRASAAGRGHAHARHAGRTKRQGPAIERDPARRLRASAATVPAARQEDRSPHEAQVRPAAGRNAGLCRRAKTRSNRAGWPWRVREGGTRLLLPRVHPRHGVAVGGGRLPPGDRTQTAGLHKCALLTAVCRAHASRHRLGTQRRRGQSGGRTRIE